MAFNDTISDGLVRHNISLLRYDAKLRRQILGQLRTLQNSLVEQLGSVDFSNVARRARLEGLLKQVDEVIKGSYRDMNRFMAGEMGDLAVSEHAFGSTQLNSLFGVDIVSAGLSPATLRAMSKDSAIFGAPAAEHWGRQSARLRRAFADEMRQGFLLGESTQDLVRRVRGSATGARQLIEVAGKSKSVPVFQGGIMNVSTREAAALVRTSVQSVANEIRLTTYEANTDVIESVVAVVTLDARTSDICQAHGSRPDEWTLPDYEPVGSTSSNFPGAPPWHFNCRSSLAPTTKSWKDLQKQGNAKGATRKQQAIARKLDNNAPKATRASMNGQVAKGLSYTQWLNKQPKSIQVEAMGPTRQKLWKQGKLDPAKTLDQTGRPMTLSEMGLADEAAIGRTLPNVSTRRAPLASQQPEPFVAPPKVTTVSNAGLTDLKVGQQFEYLGDVFKVHKVTPTGVEALPWSTRTGKFVTARNRKTLAFKAKKPIKPPTGPTGTTKTTAGAPKAPFVEAANYRRLEVDEIFKDNEGNIWKVYKKTARGVKVVPWSTKSNRFLAPRNGKTFGYTSAPGKTVKQFKQSTANATEAVENMMAETNRKLVMTATQRSALRAAQKRMGENGFNKGLADFAAGPLFRAKVINLGRRGKLKDPWGRRYSGNADGVYWGSTQHVALREGLSHARSMKVWIHELGHHMDYTLFRNRFRMMGFGTQRVSLSASSEALLGQLDDAYKAMITEYRSASKTVGKRLGLRMKGGIMSERQQTGNWHSIGRNIEGVTQSSYSLHNEKEWFAEAFSHYFNADGSRTLMARWQPETYNFMQTMFSREMELLWKELGKL